MWRDELGPGWRRERDRTAERPYGLYVDGAASPDDFAASVAMGLRGAPPTLDPKWLYDAEGSSLYERITATEAYYPTRVEDALLARIAPEVRDAAGAATVVELGSGSSAKTRHLLDAWAARGPVRYVAVDVSEPALRGACAALAARYPGAEVDALVATYDRGLGAIAGGGGPKLVAFLGSSLGNFDRDRTRAFLAQVAATLRPGDHLLLGVDLVKPEPVLRAAYDDPEGWTRRFIFNAFARMNRELGAGVPVDALRYEARWNAADAQVEMWVHLDRAVRFGLGTHHVTLPAGAAILVEVSRKFTQQEVTDAAGSVGLAPVAAWTDPRGWFADLLFRA